MDGIEDIISVLGNGAQVGIFLMLWRFDRRILKLELQIEKKGN